jgi:hypothetical protein
MAPLEIQAQEVMNDTVEGSVPFLRPADGDFPLTKRLSDLMINLKWEK